MSPMGKLLYLLLAMPAMALVGVALSTTADLVYQPYASTAPAGISPLDDQRLAGALMWLGGGGVVAAAFLACGWRALVAEERRALAREARGGEGR
jgi:putative membrane protein